MNMDFKIQAPFEPAGDQPQAIAKLAEGVEQGLRTQVLLGATGTGKTYVMASVVKWFLYFLFFLNVIKEKE